MRKAKKENFPKEIIFPEGKTDIKFAATRDGFGEGLLALGKKHKNVVALTADLDGSTKTHDFAVAFPNRFYEIGICEQNLASVAAGMAKLGKVPFIASFAAFSPGRNWDQIRVSICYSKYNVKIHGSHAGLTVGEDGATHQALEDIAILRSLPNMTIIVPADSVEAKQATIASYYIDSPVYLRTGREKVPVITKEKDPFKIGVAKVLKTGKDLVIIACGIMVNEALLASYMLENQGISCTVINSHTIKPLDSRTILKHVKKAKGVIVAEEHQKIGGLGSAVCELLSEKCPKKVYQIGMNDCFGESGRADELLIKYKLSAKEIVKAGKQLLNK